MKTSPVSFHAFALPGIPLVQSGDNLALLILEAFSRLDAAPEAGDVLVVSSKIVSKSEGCRVSLDEITPGAQARTIAAETAKDPRLVELALRESVHISRKGKGVLVTQHRLGFVSAMSGIDQSNVDSSGQHVLLLPMDPDASARAIRAEIQQKTGVEVAVIISDTHGRPFRMGNVGVAIGVAGMAALVDLRGQPDLFGRELQISQQGYADMAASAAHLLCGEADEGRPVIVLRGLQYQRREGQASELYRLAELDLYR